MQLHINGIDVSVSDAAVAEAVRRQLLGPDSILVGRGVTSPTVGEALYRGTYAGLTIHGDEPCRLILLPDEAENLTWDKAKAWAIEQGGELPSRIDMLVLWQNLRGLFKKEAYWTSAPCEGDSGSAWYQDFSYGYQGTSHTDYELRARAVRRLPIE